MAKVKGSSYSALHPSQSSTDSLQGTSRESEESAGHEARFDGVKARASKHGVPIDITELAEEEVEWCCGYQPEDIKNQHWERYGLVEVPDVFAYHKVSIVHDGGLKDVSKLLYPMQYVYAAVKLLGVATNCYLIYEVDKHAWFGTTNAATSEAKQGFLITEMLASKVTSGTAGHGTRVVQLIEICYMFWNILAVFICLFFGVVLAKHLSHVNGRSPRLNKWTLIQVAFWDYFAELVGFSALKCLYYVTPTVLVTQIYNVAIQVSQMMQIDTNNRIEGIVTLVKFLVSRTIFFLIGFDSFLVKLRITAHYARGDPSMYSMLMIAQFLFQVLGAVKIARFLRERFHIYLFGGEDGQLDHDEQMLIEVWDALVTRKIFKTFGKCKGTIVMLAFDDYDFQLLTLDDEEAEIRHGEHKQRQHVSFK